ncbi:MAG: putative quinol monooxygenase [Sulfitobacter sp.]
MFAVTVRFEIVPDQMEAFLPLMIANARMSRNEEPGCQQFDVCRDGTLVLLYELYDDRAAFDAHLETDHFKDFAAKTTPMIASKDIHLFEDVIR